MVSVNTVSGNGLFSSGGASFGENFMQQAWDNFIALTSWMANTTILTIGGVDFTFLGIGVFCVAWILIVELIQKIFWGE